MMMKDGGYFIHASSDVSDTCVYEKTSGMKIKLPPKPLNVVTDGMNYWKVEFLYRGSSELGAQRLTQRL
jgi:hypothetical protein